MCMPKVKVKNLFHTDIQEYEFPSGIISDEGWKELDVYYWENVDNWPTAKGKVKSAFRGSPSVQARPIIGDTATVSGNTKAPGGPKYVGSFTKRFSKFQHQVAGINMPTEAISQVGNIFSKHSSGGGKHFLDFTKKINWTDGDFGDGGSCFWGCRSGAKDLLMDNGAYAVRLYRQNAYYDSKFDGIGRAFLLPHPDNSNVYVLFNAYGPLTYTTLARLIAYRHGLSYFAPANVSNNDTCEGVLYINSGRGALLGTVEDIAEVTGDDSYPSVDFGIDESDYDERNPCSDCGDNVHPDEAYSSPDGDTLCGYCFERNYFCCHHCNETYALEDSQEWRRRLWCNHCLEREGVVRCDCCDKLSDDNRDVNGETICSSCFEDNYCFCEHCSDLVHNDEVTECDGDCYCTVCAAAQTVVCGECHERVLNENSESVNGKAVCNDCVEELEEAAT